MKKRYLTALIYLIGGVLLWFGPKTLFQVCDTSDKVMKCYWVTQGEVGIAIILLAAGVFVALTNSKEQQLGIYKLILIVNLVGVLIPSVLIGGCANQMMLCQKVTFPVFYLIHAVLFLWTIICIVREYTSK